jgi:alkylation response protein AidB-like acyl-CoA dehydrogenase
MSDATRRLNPADLAIEGVLGDQADWREEVSSWLAANVPKDWRRRMTGASAADYASLQREWLRTLVEGGFAAPHWPREWGGGGYDVPHQIVLAEELARAGAPHLGLHHLALYHAAATILHAGTEEQCRRFLPGILAGEIWCQGFSEPNAGSDLGALQTRARRSGDVYVVDGQKTWTTNAQYADFCLLLTRTDPDAPKHQGITYMVLDMSAPGLEIRPIRTSLGEPEFCEVFLDGVEIPVANRLGGENEGWPVILRTLTEERGPHVLEGIERLRMSRTALYEEALRRSGGDPDPAVLEELGAIQAETEALRLLCYRMLASLRSEDDPGPRASIVKVAYSELLRRLAEVGMRVAGMPAQLLGPHVQGVHYESNDWEVDYINSWAWTISGGSNEIQRNIVAERMLGLPRA